MATYTFGSESRAHERSLLACPTLRWLGIHAADISHFRVPTSLKIDMTERERSSVRTMLQRQSFHAKPELLFWRQQLQMFLDQNWYLDVIFPLHEALPSCLILQKCNGTFVPHPLTIRIPYTGPVNMRSKPSTTCIATDATLWDSFQEQLSGTRFIVATTGRTRVFEAWWVQNKRLIRLGSRDLNLR